MNAMTVNQTGNFVKNSVPLPEIKADECLVRVKATAVNRADILQRQGKYPPLPGVTDIIGLECSGEIVDPNTLEGTGEKVMALLPGGGYAQYVKVLKSHTVPLMYETQTWEEAAAIPEVWCTAYQLLHLIARVQEGETCLIHAAASGVGTAMLQLCRVANVNTIAVASQDSKLEFCQSLGASHLINYKQTPQFSEQVKAATGGRGVDVIQDPVLASNFSENLNCIAQDCRWVIYGSMGGIKVKEATIVKLLMKRASILCSTLRNRTDSYKTDLIQKVHDEKARFEKGELKPIIDQVMNLSEVAEAHNYVESNRSIGKVVLINDL